MQQYTPWSLCILASVVMLSFPSAGLEAQPSVKPPPDTPVLVTNTPAAPVPVVIPEGVTISGDVEITNTTPIPVTVVPPASTSQVMCFAKGASSSSSIGQALQRGGFSLSGGLQCPVGVSGVNVRRVIVSPNFSSLPAQNALTFSLVVGVAVNAGLSIENAEILGAFSYGDLEKTLSTPVTITPGLALIEDGACVGAPTATVRCSVGYFFFGDPIP